MEQPLVIDGLLNREKLFPQVVILPAETMAGSKHSVRHRVSSNAATR